MIKSNYRVLGVMSGTSLDGIDLAVCDFAVEEDQQWSYSIGAFTTLPYSKVWKNRLRTAVDFSKGRLHTLDREYTIFLADKISAFIKENKLEQLDAVCSHGHTVLHRPEAGITYQIGNLKELAEITGQIVVCDFRKQDVEFGGQGAPLVPIGDRLLFGSYDYCVNLGGFANISFEGANGRVAYDICGVNIVLNALAEQLSKAFDEDGRIAAKHEVNQMLLDQLEGLDFYQRPAPKSLGLEWIQETIWPILNASEISVETKIATYTEHVARQLAAAIPTESRVLVTGGGAYNMHLINRLRALGTSKIELPSTTTIEYKEALIFGFLGVLRLRNEVNCLASVTGAAKDHSSGVVFRF